FWRELLNGLAQFQVVERAVLGANFRKLFDLNLKSNPPPLSAKMFSAYLADNSEEPGFKRPLRFIGVPRLVYGNHSFLTDILDLAFVRQAAAQESRNDRANVYE